MIVFRTYNVIIPIFQIEDKMHGGMEQFHNVFAHTNYQSDEYLVAVAVANATEVRMVFQELLKMGLSFDDERDASDDFAVMAKEGIWWPVPWLIHNNTGCWFIADVEAPTEKTKHA